MTVSFELCPSCNRHVRSDEKQCPFCSAQVAGLLGSVSSRSGPRPQARVGRAALLAASTLATAACGDVGVVPVYGAPAAGGSNQGNTGGEMNAQPVYGAPFTGGTDQGGASQGGAAGSHGELQKDD